MKIRSVSPLSRAQKEAIRWHCRLNSGPVTEKLRRDFDDWLALTPEHVDAYQMIQHFWDDFAGLADIGHAELERARDFAGNVKAVKRRRLSGMLMVLLLAGLPLIEADGVLRLGSRSYQTAKGASLRIALSGANSIVLNTDSALQVLDVFGWKRAWLDRGEAWFDIQHDPNQPFVVKTPQAQITDIGTRFNVLSEPSKTTVTVAHGQVEMASETLGNMTLTANQQGYFDALARVSEKARVDAEAIALWRSGVMVFQNQPLSEVLDQIKRYHSIEFTVPDAGLQRKLISGRFAASDLSTTLHTLSVGMNVTISHAEPGHFLIRKP